MKSRISGKEATYAALEASKRPPIRLEAAKDSQETRGLLKPSDGPNPERQAPPRVSKPSPGNDQCLAPTADLESHRTRLREAFGNTMSDEFVAVALGKLIEALRPSPFDHLEETTLNAALATIASMKPQSELQAIMAVEIVATGFSGLRFLRQSHRHMTEAYINVYGNYALKLLRLQTELIHAFDRYGRGNKQTVEVRHVHIHSRGRGVVGIINAEPKQGSGQK